MRCCCDLRRCDYVCCARHPQKFSNWFVVQGVQGKTEQHGSKNGTLPSEKVLRLWGILSGEDAKKKSHFSDRGARTLRGARFSLSRSGADRARTPPSVGQLVALSIKKVPMEKRHFSHILSGVGTAFEEERREKKGPEGM